MQAPCKKDEKPGNQACGCEKSSMGVAANRAVAAGKRALCAENFLCGGNGVFNVPETPSMDPDAEQKHPLAATRWIPGRAEGNYKHFQA